MSNYAKAQSDVSFLIKEWCIDWIVKACCDHCEERLLTVESPAIRKKYLRAFLLLDEAYNILK